MLAEKLNAQKFQMLPVAHSKHLLVLSLHNMVLRAILPPRLLIMNHSMPMTECTSFNILTTESNMATFYQQCSKSKCFCKCPVNAFPCLNHPCSIIINLFYLVVRLEIIWKDCDCFAHSLQQLWLDPVTARSFNIELEGTKARENWQTN